MDIINLNQLLEATSAGEPSGDDLEYDPLFGEMERAAKGREEQQFGDTLIAAEEPDWTALKAHALAVLDRSKDLRAAVQLTRALVHTAGYAGLAAGLSLIRGYLEDFWESLYPRLDPDDHNDPTIRINALLNLCDHTDFLVPIAKLPLVSSSRMGQFSHREIQVASGAVPRLESEQRQISLEQIEAAFREAEPAQTQSTRLLINQSIEALGEIGNLVSGKLAMEKSFDLQPLIQQLKGAERELADRSWSGNPMDPSATGDVGHLDADSLTQPGNPAAPGDINGRDDVIRSLDRICYYYSRHEPSSPVPLLLQRAKRLVTMGFHDIVQDLAPDGQSHFDFLWRQGDG